MKPIQLCFIAVVALLSSLNAHATITAQAGALNFDSIAASADFESYVLGQSVSNPLSSGGFTLAQSVSNDFAIYSYNVSGPIDSKYVYQNGGSNSLLSIVMADASDFDQLVFDVINGWSVPSPQYIWLRTYNDGVATGIDFDFDLSFPGTLSVWTDGLTVFDEVRVGAYVDSATRDAHVETGFSAVGIDNLTAGTRERVVTVAVPATIPLFGLALAALGFATRRARKSNS